MDAFRLSVELVTGLVWPIVVIWVVHTFRQDIRNVLAERNAKLKAGPFELAIEQTRVDVEAAATPIPTSRGRGGEQKHPAITGLLDSDLLHLADSEPSRAVLAAFAAVERVLRDKLEAAGADPLRTKLVSGVQLAVAAQRQGLITSQSLEAVQGLAVLRNLTAHDMAQVDSARAKDYLQLVEATLFALHGPVLGPDVPCP